MMPRSINPLCDISLFSMFVNIRQKIGHIELPTELRNRVFAALKRKCKMLACGSPAGLSTSSNCVVFALHSACSATCGVLRAHELRQSQPSMPVLKRHYNYCLKLAHMSR
jgi:hypothetical protein